MCVQGHASCGSSRTATSAGPLPRASWRTKKRSSTRLCSADRNRKTPSELWLVGFVVHDMLMTTTSVLEGRPVSRYIGVVTGEAIIGANVFRDMFAAVRDIVGGRSATYEKALAEARDVALAEMQKR